MPSRFVGRMIIISERIRRKEHSKIHWDLIEETCRSFNVSVIERTNAIIPHNGNVIALRHDKGVSIEDYDITKVEMVLVGSDDSGDDKWLDGYTSIRIPTPNSYFLWSGVALGIFLYQHHLTVLQ